MYTLSDLENPEVARHSVVLGSSYSLTPDGLPGTYNRLLAEQIKSVLVASRQHKLADRPWVGVQWEIFDALEHKWGEQNLELCAVLPLPHVGAPPLYTPDDIGDLKAIVNHLKMCCEDFQRQQANQDLINPSTQAGRQLAAQLSEMILQAGDADNHNASFGVAMGDTSKLANYFNQILNDENFHTRFYQNGLPCLELHDLYQAKSGSVGFETRQLPAEQAILRRFQKNRSNRFILESIFPDVAVLKRGSYLSTKGVLEQVKSVMEQEGERDIRNVFIFGHPEHSPRCKRQTCKSSLVADGNLDPSYVVDVNNSDPNEMEIWQGAERWDEQTAQMWCRSKQNWDDYERMGRLG